MNLQEIAATLQAGVISAIALILASQARPMFNAWLANKKELAIVAAQEADKQREERGHERTSRAAEQKLDLDSRHKTGNDFQLIIKDMLFSHKGIEEANRKEAMERTDKILAAMAMLTTELRKGMEASCRMQVNK